MMKKVIIIVYLERGNMKTAKKTVRELRKERHINRLYMCDRLGIKPNTLSRKEDGSRKFTNRELMAICDILGVAPHEVEELN